MSDKILEGEIVNVNLESEELQQQIEDTTEAILEGNALFVSGFARLGYLLNIVRQKKYWQDWGHSSFGSYIKEIETRVKRGRSQIYSAISVADRLLPYTDEATLEKIGISKATELAKMIKFTGAAPSDSALRLAENPLIEIEEFKAFLHEENHVQKLDDKGKFFDLKGFYCTPEERQEIEYVFDLAAKIDPPIPQETSEWERRKEIIFRLIREFRGTYEQEILGEHND
jgi:hypothetical protein